MPTSTAGGLQLTGTASTSLRNIFHPQPLPWSRCEETKKRHNNTTTGRPNFDHRTPPFYRKVTKTKLRHSLVLWLWRMFRSSTRLPICGRAVRVSSWEGSFQTRRWYSKPERCFVERRTTPSSSKKGKQLSTPYAIAVNRYFPEARTKQLVRVTRQTLTVRDF